MAGAMKLFLASAALLTAALQTAPAQTPPEAPASPPPKRPGWFGGGHRPEGGGPDAEKFENVRKAIEALTPEQRKRFQERYDDPAKRWKFKMGDLEERALWDDYQAAFDEALTKTSTPWAPWYVIPANRNWFRNLAVSTILADTIAGLKPAYPPEPDLPVNLVIE